MSVKTKRGKLRLAWVDETGHCYHEQDVSPTLAKELLSRSRMWWIDCPGKWYGFPLTSFSRAAVSRSTRGLVAKEHQHVETEKQARVIITLTEDNIPLDLK